MAPFFFINKPSNVASSQDLYAAYYEAYNPNDGVRGAPVADNIAEFRMKYKAKNYSEALPLLEEIQTQKTELEWNLYKAICLMEIGQETEAEQLFLQLSDLDAKLLADESKWYLSMLYLKNDNKSIAQVLLQELASGASGDHAQEAKEILAQI